jgi:hypothetical protein
MLVGVSRDQTQFNIQEAGGLLYVTDRSVIEGTAGQGPITGGELYQDDGFNVRVVLGELTPDEQVNWTSRIVSELHLPTGQMIVSGVLDPDFDRWLEDFGVAEDEGEYELGSILEVEPGLYALEIHGLPPNDLGSGWMKIEDQENFALANNIPTDSMGGQNETAQEYFERTRPGEPVPEWIEEGYEDAEFLDFVIRLERIGDADAAAAESAGQQFLDWEFRKPDVCPVGIRL